MKNKLILLAALTVLALVGCQVLIGTFTATISGTSWDAGFSGAVKNGSNQYIITATKSSSSIVITIPGTTTGTYNINPTDTTLEALVYTPNTGSPSNNYISTQGNVNLTKISEGRLTGTFDVWALNSQTTTDSIQISGQFNNILSN